jgi:hypothetical protein
MKGVNESWGNFNHLTLRFKFSQSKPSLNKIFPYNFLHPAYVLVFQTPPWVSNIPEHSGNNFNFANPNDEPKVPLPFNPKST